MPDEIKTEAKKPALQPLKPSGLKGLDFGVRQWQYDVPGEYRPEDLMKPSTWAHMAAKLKRGHLILCRSEFWTWTGLFQVYDAGDNWAKVHPLWVKMHENMDFGTPTEHLYRLDRTVNGWRVINKDTGKVVKDKLASKEEAQKALDAEVLRAA